MYRVENKSKEFYIFNLENRQYINSKFSLNELINYVSHYNLDSFCRGKYGNEILNNINITLKDENPDRYIHQDLDRNLYRIYKVELRKYVILDGYLRIVDLRDYKKEIIKKRYCLQRRFWQLNYSRSNVAKLINFRSSPIPNIGKNKNIKDYRVPKVTNEIRQCNIETDKYIRSKRKSKALIQEVHARYTQKSWKTQSKKKYQWM